MAEEIKIQNLTDADAGKRLDVVLAELFPDYSRSCLKRWILQGQVLLDGKSSKPKIKVTGSEQIQLNIQPIPAQMPCQAEPVPLNVIFEDEAIIVINKPAGLVVHPAAGHYSGTLQNGLLYYAPELGEIPRAGIVHRLDKDTSGLMVVARSLVAHHYLTKRIQQHDVLREYQAIVQGVLTGGGSVEQPIGRHPHDRIRMAIRENGRHAVTHYRLIQRFRAHSHIRVQLETGRTHQIRVHMSHLHHALVGDPVYGGRQRLPGGAEASFRLCLQQFNRQALHASRLMFEHPLRGDSCHFEAPLPDDMCHLLKAMDADFQQHHAD